MTRAAPCHGMTLVEVVAALVLLALLGAALLPMLIEARRATVAQTPARARDDLAAEVDAWLATPEGARVAASSEEGARVLTLGAVPRAVEVTRVGGEVPADHLWLAFAADGTQVLRCVVRPRDLAADASR